MALKKLDEKEVKKIIVDLDTQGLTSEKIGLVLKSKHGVKSLKKDYGFSISSITGKNDAERVNVKSKFDVLKKHFDSNKHDQPSKRKLITTAARIKKLDQYFG